MQYHRLDFNWYDDDETGSDAQVTDIFYPEDPEAELLYTSDLSGVEPVPAVIPRLILAPGAKRTDLINCAADEIRLSRIVSYKLKMILEHYSTDLRFLETTLVDEGRDHEYWIVHPSRFHMEAIDFPKSVCTWTEEGKDSYDYVINSFEEFERRNRTTGYGIVMELALKNDLTQDLLVLKDVFGGIAFYVSEKLRDVILSNHCTGIMISSINFGLDVSFDEEPGLPGIQPG